MNTVDMRVIELNGTSWERGCYYGELAKPMIAEVVANWRSDLGNFGQNSLVADPVDADEYLRRFLSETNYLKGIVQWTPHLLKEVRGIAKTSGQAFEDILGLSLMDEEWTFGLRKSLDRTTDKCTAFGLPNPGSHISYAGQNMDIGSWVDGRQVLLRVMPHPVTYFDNTFEAPEALVFSNAGNIALNGMNANGLGITCNTLAQLQHSITGLPISFIVRAVLEQPNIDQAEKLIRAIEHASGQSFILSSQGEMRCFECSGGSVVRYAPKEFQDRLFHTNHPLISSDVSDISGLNKNTVTTIARFKSITERLGDPKLTPRLSDIKAALAAHDDPDNPVSRYANDQGSSIGFTAGSSIYELGVIPRLHLAAGPPCETEFEVFDFSTLND